MYLEPEGEAQMNRRKFLTGMASAGVAMAGLAAAHEIFVPFAGAVEIPDFTFAHITDLHLDIKGESTWQYREKSVPLFVDALRQLGRLPKLKFVVFGGDQIHYGANDKESLDVFQKWTANLGMPIYILLGNTEVSPVTGGSRLGREDYLKAWSNRGLNLGQSSWAFEPAKGVRVIGFDVTANGKAHGVASPKELKWLENELEENSGKKLIILFTHQLLRPATPRDKTAEWSVWMVRNHQKVTGLLERYPNVRLVVSGHHHVSRVETVGRITYVSDPAIVTYPCAFRTFTVSKEGITIQTVGLDDTVMVNRAKELLVSDPFARMYDAADPQKAALFTSGLNPEDREATIKL